MLPEFFIASNFLIIFSKNTHTHFILKQFFVIPKCRWQYSKSATKQKIKKTLRNKNVKAHLSFDVHTVFCVHCKFKSKSNSFVPLPYMCHPANSLLYPFFRCMSICVHCMYYSCITVYFGDVKKRASRAVWIAHYYINIKWIHVLLFLFICFFRRSLSCLL